MYFSKQCWFTRVIRGFSFSVKIPLEAQTAPAFIDLNSFSFLHIYYARGAIQPDPECGPNTSTRAETHTKHVYMHVRSLHIGGLSLLYGSRTVEPSLQPCQMVVIQFEISRATSDTHCTMTWQPWQRSVSYICQPLSQGLRRLFCFTDVNCRAEIQTYETQMK